MEVESVVADAPGDGALLVARLVRLALDARVHYVVSADCAVVNMNIPGPQRHRIPLLDLKDLLLRLQCAVARHTRIGHLLAAGGVNLIRVHFVIFE